MNLNKKWYQKTWAIVALIILFFPVGLFLMWTKSNWSKKVKWIVTVFFGFLILIGGIGNNSDKSSVPNQSATPQPIATNKPSTPPPSPTNDDLNADIRFSETAVMITNKEEKEWTKCKLEINSGLFSGGYTYMLSSLKPNDPTIIALRDFTKGDGTRFDSYSTKPQNISLSCDVNGKNGFGYYSN